MKLVTVGAPTVNGLALVPVPLLVVTLTRPEVALPGTVTVIWMALSTVKVVAEVPLNFTALAPVKPVPLITTLAPVKPAVGVKLVTVGAAATVKLVALVAWPPGVSPRSDQIRWLRWPR